MTHFIFSFICSRHTTIIIARSSVTETVCFVRRHIPVASGNTWRRRPFALRATHSNVTASLSFWMTEKWTWRRFTSSLQASGKARRLAMSSLLFCDKETSSATKKGWYDTLKWICSSAPRGKRTSHATRKPRQYLAAHQFKQHYRKLEPKRAQERDSRKGEISHVKPSWGNSSVGKTTRIL